MEPHRAAHPALAQTIAHISSFTYQYSEAKRLLTRVSSHHPAEFAQTVQHTLVRPLLTEVRGCSSRSGCATFRFLFWGKVQPAELILAKFCSCKSQCCSSCLHLTINDLWQKGHVPRQPVLPTLPCAVCLSMQAFTLLLPSCLKKLLSRQKTNA